MHEHPKPSMSWQEPEMKQLEELPAIYKVQSPMCKWKMISEDSQGLGYVRKETQWLTNSPEVAKAIQGKLKEDIDTSIGSTDGHEQHRSTHHVL